MGMGMVDDIVYSLFVSLWNILFLTVLCRVCSVSFIHRWGVCSIVALSLRNKVISIMPMLIKTDVVFCLRRRG